MAREIYAVRDFNGEGRLLPKGMYKRPWYVIYLRHSLYPSFGRHTFMEHINDDDRNKLWDVYELGGEDALFDAAKHLDETVWITRYRQEKYGAASRGRAWLESV